MKPTKYLYGWRFYTNSGAGWDYENFEETWKAMRVNLTAYAENSSVPFKVVRGREINPAYPWTHHEVNALRARGKNKEAREVEEILAASEIRRGSGE